MLEVSISNNYKIFINLYENEEFFGFNLELLCLIFF